MWLSLPVVVGLAITSTRFHRLTGYWGLVNESAGNRLWADTDVCRLDATWQTPDGASWHYWFGPPSKPSKGPGDEVKFEGYVVDPDILAAITRERTRGVPLVQRIARRLWNISLLVAGNLPWPESNYHDPVSIVGTGITLTRYEIGETFRDILQWVVLPLGAMGLLLGRRNALLYLLAANVVTAVVAAAFFFGEARYHVPYDPFLLLLAVTGGYEVLRRGRSLMRGVWRRLSIQIHRGREEPGALAHGDLAREAPSSWARVGRRGFALALVAAALGLTLHTIWSFAPGGSRSEPGPPTVAWHHGLTAKGVEAVLDPDSRLVQIQVQQTSPLLFNVAVAKNTGLERRDWWWVPGTGPELTASELGAFATLHEARVVSMAPYVREGTTHLAAVLIRNSGFDERSWWWYFDLPRESVDRVVTEQNAQPIDLRSYLKDGRTAYALVMVGKSGPDERSWWYTGASRSFVKAELEKNRASLVSVQSAAVQGDGALDVIIDNQPPGATGLFGVSWVWAAGDAD
jgi:hypothetical protein